MLVRIFAILVAATQCAFAQWSVTRTSDETNAGVVHRHFDLAEKGSGANAIVDLAIFSATSARLRVIDNGLTRGDLADAMRRTRCIAGVNGGYFDTEFAPLGLRVIDGKQTSPLGHGRLMSGVFASNGAIQLMRTAEFGAHRKVNAAIQCGPMLVDLAKPVRGLEATREARRTFAAMSSDNLAAVGVCSDVTLAQMGEILAALKFRRALNFDGGSSTAFWFKRENGSAFSIGEEKTVRDFVGVTTR